LFWLPSAFHENNLSKRNKEVGCAVGFSQSTPLSHTPEKAPVRGASRDFLLQTEQV
jgi:hypothetical protein